MISVQEFVDNKELLEIYYITAEKYIEVADAIIEKSIETENGINYLNHANINIMAPIVFLSVTTNIDVISEQEDTGLSGYDALNVNGDLEPIFNACASKYAEFKRILDDKIKMFEQKNLSFYAYANSLLNVILDVIKGINSEDVQSFLSALEEQTNDK